MGLVEGLTQSLGRYMRVALCRGQARMAEEFLDGPQVGTTLQDMGCRGVSKPVRCKPGHPGVDGGPVHHRADRPWIDPATLDAEQ